MQYLIVNTKNYLQVMGKRLDQLCSFVEKNHEDQIRILIAVPAFELRSLNNRFRVELLTQHLDDADIGSSTGWLAPEIARLEGASGSILNHSEHRIKMDVLSKLVTRLRILNMTSFVCARSVTEVSKIATLAPEFIAIEPPELIGTGRSVAKYSPTIISRSLAALNNSRPIGARTKLLCGAGIVNSEDVRKAIELGSDGVLVASGIVLAKNWKAAITNLLSGFQRKN